MGTTTIRAALVAAALLATAACAASPETAPASGAPRASVAAEPASAEPTPEPTTPEATTEPTGPEQPAAWAGLTDCQDDAGLGWHWVGDFPADLLAPLGVPQCGQVRPFQENNTFAYLLYVDVPRDTFDALLPQTLAAGYQENFNEYDPALVTDDDGGRIEYAKEDTILAYEVYPGSDGTTWDVFVDYHSPTTRAIG